MGPDANASIQFYMENASAIKIRQQKYKITLGKHIDVQLHHIVHHLKTASIHFQQTPRTENQAGIFTKAIRKAHFKTGPAKIVHQRPVTLQCTDTKAGHDSVPGLVPRVEIDRHTPTECPRAMLQILQLTTDSGRVPPLTPLADSRTTIQEQRVDKRL